MDIFKVARSFPILYSSSLFWIHFDSLCTHDKTQVFDFLVVKFAPFWFEVQTSCLKCFQDQVHMFLVFFKSIGVNQRIIKVCGAKSSEVGSENIVDEVLKCCRGIGETKRHNQRLKKAVLRAEGSFLFLPFCHSDEVIGPPNIQFCKPLYTG
jgi:hypothetical protein